MLSLFHEKALQLGFTSGVGPMMGLLLSAFVFYRLSKVIYDAFYHPLASFPGPVLWSTTYLFRHISAMRGRLDWQILAFHEQYGEVVRISPDELSFIGEQAWRDIYGHKEAPLAKDPAWYNVVSMPDQAASIFNADHHNHARIRKQLAHAFSEKALREQEGVIRGFADLLIERLKDVAVANMTADMVRWYNFASFDMIGDLALGKSFGCLKNSNYHSWVDRIFKSIKIGPFMRAAATYTDIQRLLRLLAPAAVKEARFQHEQYVQIHGQERLSKGIMDSNKDFISYILKNRDAENGVTDQEIIANCNFLILAGSETTATALSGLTYHLLNTPDVLQKVTHEVRSAFRSEEEINFLNATSRLPYTLACIHEALRLYPPGPSLFPRRTPKGVITSIAGHLVPGWVILTLELAMIGRPSSTNADQQTSVGVHALASTRSLSNFHQPTVFIPERWLTTFTADPHSPFHKDRLSASQPFSTGPRNCLGRSLAYNEMRIIIARVLWNFDLELCAESKAWDQQLTYTLWEKHPLMCRLYPVGRDEAL